MDSDEIVYVGCYTKPKQADPFLDLGGIPHDESKVGQGVLAIQLSKTGKLSHLGANKEPMVVIPASVVPNPSYLCFVQGKEEAKERIPALLCVVSETEPEGRLFTFGIEKDMVSMQQLGTAHATGGSCPCHVSCLKQGSEDRALFVSNYGSDQDGGSLSVYTINNTETDHSNLQISLAKNIVHGRDRGSRVDPLRQGVPHVHCCVQDDSSDNEVFVADLGADAIVHYQMDETKTLVEVGRLACASGPRSILFNTNSDHVDIGAVSLELSAQVQLVQIRQQDRCLEALGDPESILPVDWPSMEKDKDLLPFNNGRWGSDLAWTENGRFLLAAARLHNSISVFELLHDERKSSNDGLKTPRLQLKHRMATGGKSPRCILVSQNILLVAHQHSHDVSSFEIDPYTGTLTFIDKIEAPLAACVKIAS